MMKAMVFGMNCKEIIIFLVLLYQPKKNTSLLAYGDNDTNAIYKNTKRRFTPRFSQAANWTVTLLILTNRQRIWCSDWLSKWLTRKVWPNNSKQKNRCCVLEEWTRYRQGQEKSSTQKLFTHKPKSAGRNPCRCSFGWCWSQFVSWFCSFDRV